MFIYICQHIPYSLCSYLFISQTPSGITVLLYYNGFFRIFFIVDNKTICLKMCLFVSSFLRYIFTGYKK